MIFHAVSPVQKSFFLPELWIDSVGYLHLDPIPALQSQTFPNVNSFPPATNLFLLSHSIPPWTALSCHQSGSHAGLLPLFYLTLHVQSPGCVHSASLIYFTSTCCSFSTARNFSQDLLLSYPDYWTTSCLRASQCQADFFKDTCQFYHCLV